MYRGVTHKAMRNPVGITPHSSAFDLLPAHHNGNHLLENTGPKANEQKFGAPCVFVKHVLVLHNDLARS